LKALDNLLGHDISLVVVGPELPLALGITDHLQQVWWYSPQKQELRLRRVSLGQSSNAGSGIPTARSAIFTEAAAAKPTLRLRERRLLRLMAWQLGKVTVAATVEEAFGAIEAIFKGQFGSAGKFVLVEECLTGQEVLALTDGLTIAPCYPLRITSRW